MLFRNYQGEMVRVYDKYKLEQRNPFTWNPIFLRVILEHLAQLTHGDLEREEPADYWEVVWTGCNNGKDIRTDLPGRNVEIVKFRRRCIDLFAQDRRILDLIVDQGIGFLHYTGSAALRDILKYGLLGRNKQKKVGAIKTPNGFMDSTSNESRVSLDQWYSLDYQYFFDHVQTQEGRSSFISPLTKENLSLAVRNLTEAINRWNSYLDREAMGGGMLIDEFRLNLIQAIYDSYDQTLSGFGTDLERTLFVENFPVVLLTQVPRNTIIPHGHIITEVMATSVPVNQIKAVVVPQKFVRTVQSTLDSLGLFGNVVVFKLENFRCQRYPNYNLS